MKVLLCLLVGLCWSLSLLVAQDSPSQSIVHNQDNTLSKHIIWNPFKVHKKSKDQLELIYTSQGLKWFKDQTIELSIPNDTAELILIVNEVQLYTSAKENKGDFRHFRGQIKGQEFSSVSLNISPNQMSGIISDGIDDIILQPIESRSNRIALFNQKNKGENNWNCDSDLLDQHLEDIPYIGNKRLKSSTQDTLLLYLEADFDLFELHNSSITETYNYINGVMNGVATVYAMEDIVILIDELKVWNTPDPYNKKSSLEALIDFKTHVNNNFEGQLAHLISGSPNRLGGIAYVNGICNRSAAYGFSNVHGNYDEISSYSWDVHVIAHELGHNLGSRHTHDCVWGPEGNQAIDACVDNNCGGDIPINGGTVMSYCHNNPVGIDLTLGFGVEPGNLMRYYMNACLVDRNSNCYQAQEIEASGIYSVSEPNNGFGASYTSAKHATWFKITALSNGYISGASCNQNVDTRVILHEGNCSALNTITLYDDVCQSGNGLFYAASFDSIPIEAGKTYFIEWDNRWSDSGFNFDFTVEYEEALSNSCTNGIQDGDETGIDCGGSYCLPCCTNVATLEPNIDHSMAIMTNDSISVNSHLNAPASVLICSGQNISFEAGFEITIGADLTANIEECITQ